MSRKKASLYRWKQNNKCRLLCIRWQPIRSRLARHWMATLLPTWISTTHHTKLFFFVWDFIITQVYLQWCHIYESYNMSHRFWLIFHCWFNFGKFDVGVWEDILGLGQIFGQKIFFENLNLWKKFLIKKYCSTDGN